MNQPNDAMDRLLAKLPVEVPPDDLAFRIIYHIRLQHQRVARQRLTASLIIAICGVWLAIPSLFGWMQSLRLPDSGLSVLLSWLSVALAGLESLGPSLLEGAASMQSTITTWSGPSSWLGLIALGFSALLALNSLLPGGESS